MATILALVLVLIVIGSGVVSLAEPVVVVADCLKLGPHRRHDHPHVLDYRVRLYRHHFVYGLLRIPIPPQGGGGG